MKMHPMAGLVSGIIIGAAASFGISAVLGRDSPSPTANTGISLTADHNAQATAKLQNLRGDDFDKAFLSEMIQHHQGAIDMAGLIESNAKHDELKKLGQEIMSAQSKEIDMMQAWQSEWGYKEASQSHTPHQ